jgi:hypothetical protein
MNYQPCMLRNAEPGVEAVTKALKENSLAGWSEMLAAGSISAARKAQLDEMRKERIYIGRLDVIAQKLDGTKRYSYYIASKTQPAVVLFLYFILFYFCA